VTVVNAEYDRTVAGRLVSASGTTDVASVPVWVAHRTVDGSPKTVEGRSAGSGRFSFPLPAEALRSAVFGAGVEGVVPVDLDPNGEVLEPGDVVLVVDDLVPVHLRFGGDG